VTTPSQPPPAVAGGHGKSPWLRPLQQVRRVRVRRRAFAGSRAVDGALLACRLHSLTSSPMTRPHWFLILNGKSTGDDAVREAVQAMRARGIALEVRVTWEDGDAERYAAEALERGADVVIAGGGDGSLSEVAAALAHADGDARELPALGLLPLGTANDFAGAAGIPEDALAALELVRDTQPRAIDLLRLDAGSGSHWAVNLASGGFGTQVTVETHDGLKKILGGLAY